MAKLSLVETQAKLDEEAHNSNFQNLAHALRYLTEGEAEAEKAITKYREDVAKLRAEITALGERDGAWLTYEEVRSPYSKARTLGLTYTPGNTKGY